MDLETLNSFLILSERLNYTEASDILGITQPALSKRIRLLEDELDCKLFLRSPREVRLSPEGERLVPYAKFILAQTERIKKEIKSSSYLAPVRIGFYGLVVHNYFPAFVRFFREKHPEYLVELYSGNLKYLYNGLLDGTLNIIIASESLKSKLRNFHHLLLKRDPVYILVNEENPFSDRESLSIRDLTDETFLMLSDHNNFANAFHSSRNALLSEACLYEGISPKVKIVDYLVDLPLMVSCGEGVAIGTKNLSFCSYDNIKFIPYKAPDGKEKHFDLLAYYDDYCKDAAKKLADSFHAFSKKYLSE